MKYFVITVIICFGLISCIDKPRKINESYLLDTPDSIDRDFSDILEVKSYEELKPKKEEPVIKYRIDLDKIDSFHCNIEVINHVDMNMDSLTKKDIDALFMTIDSVCSENTEFSEVSNFVIFKTIKNYPIISMKLLQANRNKYDFEYIYSVLCYSLGAMPPIDEIEKKIIEKKLKGPIVDSVMNALKIAVETY